MHEITILTETELRSLVQLDLEAVDVVERAFAALAGGGVIMPPVMSMHMPDLNAEVDVKTAFMPGFDGFAIKASPGFFDNPSRGLPTTSGLMVLLSAETGRVSAVLLDNGYLTDIRTAAAGAVAARHLAPARVDTAGVIGTGLQARMQIEAAHLVRPFGRVLVWGRDAAKAAACAADIAATLGIEALAEADPARLVAESQLVVTATAAGEPVLRADWLHPGLLITAMGSDQPSKSEIDPACFACIDAYVPDSLAQCRIQGELRAAIDAGTAAPDQAFRALGAVVADPSARLARDGAIILCDLTGTGAQDTAIATHAARLARAAGAGTVIAT